MDVKNRVVTVKGPRGTLVKAFKHVDLEFIRIGKRRVKVNMWFATRKNMACLQTVCSHIKNLFKGVRYVSERPKAHLFVFKKRFLISAGLSPQNEGRVRPLPHQHNHDGGQYHRGHT